jgi:hypothetical protein
MLYSDKNIVISDSFEDKKELLEFMESKGINSRYYTEYINGEPFINIKPTVFRYSELEELEYVSTQELLAIVGKKNEKKEEQGYPRTKLLLIQTN